MKIGDVAVLAGVTFEPGESLLVRDSGEMRSHTRSRETRPYACSVRRRVRADDGGADTSVHKAWNKSAVTEVAVKRNDACTA